MSMGGTNTCLFYPRAHSFPSDWCRIRPNHSHPTCLIIASNKNPFRPELRAIYFTDFIPFSRYFFSGVHWEGGGWRGLELLPLWGPTRGVARHEALLRHRPPLLFLSLFSWKTALCNCTNFSCLNYYSYSAPIQRKVNMSVWKTLSIFNKLNMNIYIVCGINGIHCMEIIKAEIIFSCASAFFYITQW